MAKKYPALKESKYKHCARIFYFPKHVTCPAHQILIDLITQIKSGEKYILKLGEFSVKMTVFWMLHRVAL